MRNSGHLQPQLAGGLLTTPQAGCRFPGLPRPLAGLFPELMISARLLWAFESAIPQTIFLTENQP